MVTSTVSGALTKIILITVFFSAIAVVHARAQSRAPRFARYPASGVYAGPVAPLVLKRDDRMYRTRLREAARGKPNFAGHHIVATWGCGTGCVMGAVINAKSGRVYWLPHTTCCWGFDVDERFRPIEFRPDSKLIVFTGARDEKVGDEGAHFYKFDGGRFVFIRTVKKGAPAK